MSSRLFSLQPVGDALKTAGGPPGGLELWFAHLLRDGFAMTMAGHPATFAAVAAGAVRSVVPDIGDEAANRVLAAFSALPAHPDAAPALARLASDGIRMAALTNGAASTTRTLLTASGLDRYLSEVISVDEVGPWKPAPEPYFHAAATLAVAPADLALVAVHSWDIHGARAAGLTTGWAFLLRGRERAGVHQAVLARALRGVVLLLGHEWARRKLNPAGVAFTALDNGLRSIADAAAAHRICGRLSAGHVRDLLTR